jgi:hypothetical protein
VQTRPAASPLPVSQTRASRSCLTNSPSPWGGRHVDRQQTVNPIRKIGAAGGLHRANPGPQHEHGAFRQLAVINRRPATLRPRATLQQQRLGRSPGVPPLIGHGLGCVRH